MHVQCTVCACNVDNNTSTSLSYSVFCSLVFLIVFEGAGQLIEKPNLLTVL